MLNKKNVFIFYIITLLVFLCVYTVEAQTAKKINADIQIITCSDDTHTYALYLPKLYDLGGSDFKVLFCFDPGGSGVNAIKQFIYAGHRYDWILVGSQDAKNGPWGVILEAQEAILKDVESKYRVDKQSYYAGGFSGGARMSYTMAYNHPEKFKGVIACGAGFGLGTKNKNIPVYHCVGQKDMNYQEVQDAYKELKSMNITTEINVFKGGHGWPPADVIKAAIDWLFNL